MSETRLTQDADYLICVLYEAYRSRRKAGELAEDAAAFGGSEEIQSLYIPEWPTNDIDNAAKALDKRGFLVCNYGDDCVYGYCALTDDGIAYMENRFSDRINEFIEHIATLRSIIFG